MGGMFALMDRQDKKERFRDEIALFLDVKPPLGEGRVG